MDMREIERVEVPFRGKSRCPGEREACSNTSFPGHARREFQQFRFRATNESERSRRAIRLLFANWLAQVDKPAAERCTEHEDRGCYDLRVRPGCSRRRRASQLPRSLSRAIDETLLARWILRPDRPWHRMVGYRSWEGDGIFARERRRRSVLIVKLAAELYRRERGSPRRTPAPCWGAISRNCPRGSGGTTRFPRARADSGDRH